MPHKDSCVEILVPNEAMFVWRCGLLTKLGSEGLDHIHISPLMEPSSDGLPSEDDSNFRRLDLLGRNKLYPSPQLLTYEMRRVVLQHPSSLLCTTLPWLRNRRTKLPREKSQKWSQMGLFSFRLIFFRHFSPTVMKKWLAQDEHHLCYCIQVIFMKQMSLVLVLSL